MSCATPVRDAVLDQRQRRLGRALGVEGARQGARVSGRVGQVDRGRGDRCAEPAVERAAALGVGEPVERRIRPSSSHSQPTACGLEHHRVLAGRQLRRLAAARAPCAAARSASARASRSRGGHRRSRRRSPLRPLGAMQMTFMNASVRRSAPPSRRSSATALLLLGRRSRSRAPRRRARSRHRERGRERRAARRPGRARAVVGVVAARARAARLRAPGSPGMRPSPVTAAASAARRRARARTRRAPRRPRAFVAALPDVPVAAGPRSRRVTSSIAVACVGRPAAKRSISERSCVDEGERVSAPRPPRARAPPASSAALTPRPPRTSRKRAGALPWETRITWPGSPFPQSSSEIRRHSEGEQTASQLPQNSGVTPA